ncbi:MAG TPA: deoxyribodipyrimidine photo-lyase, partial [Ignavibacteriaceae bacterium]|nr:deoxyribodipyrimidine photo-lyase [Ignavibacteriaceae bacterium]
MEDNAGLCQALASEFPVLPIFIFDRAILDALENKSDRRVDYIHQALSAINLALNNYHSKLSFFYGKPLEIFQQLSQEYDIQAVFCNRDYEPQAIERDTEIYNFFQSQIIPFKAFKDQVIFDKNEIVKNDGTPYTVYTPYAKKWKEILTEKDYHIHKADFNHVLKQDFTEIHSLKDIGFKKTAFHFETPKLEANIIDEYDKYRDFPALQKTTQLGIALRFGTISIRKCVDFALQHNQTWLGELIWREFFMQILYHFPKVVSHSFKTKYNFIQWRNDEQEFESWCTGNTGYPIVDAGMR